MALIDKLTNIANAIRSKTGSTAPLTLDDMATEIGNIGGTVNNPRISITEWRKPSNQSNLFAKMDYSGISRENISKIGLVNISYSSTHVNGKELTVDSIGRQNVGATLAGLEGKDGYLTTGIAATYTGYKLVRPYILDVNGVYTYGNTLIVKASTVTASTDEL